MLSLGKVAHGSRGGIGHYKFLVPCLSETGLNLQTDKQMAKSWTLGINVVFVRYVLLKEANILFTFICFDHNFDNSHTNVVTPVPRKQSKNP